MLICNQLDHTPMRLCYHDFLQYRFRYLRELQLLSLTLEINPNRYRVNLLRFLVPIWTHSYQVKGPTELEWTNEIAIAKWAETAIKTVLVKVRLSLIERAICWKSRQQFGNIWCYCKSLANITDAFDQHEIVSHNSRLWQMLWNWYDFVINPGRMSDSTGTYVHTFVSRIPKINNIQWIKRE